MQVNMLDLKLDLASLVLQVEHGDEVLLERNGVPVAKIVKYQPVKIKKPGAWKLKTSYSPDWNSVQTNSEVLDLFKGLDDETIA
jgi:antitoxin (DNA-binding transcriptional repressor) of toxin-antitoxin stability system